MVCHLRSIDEVNLTQSIYRLGADGVREGENREGSGDMGLESL